MKIALKYVVSDTDRHGNVRYYYREPGKRKVRLRAKPGTAEFFEQWTAAKNGTMTAAPERETGACDGKSLRWLVAEYKQSYYWTSNIGEKTRRDRAPIIERFLENNGDGEKPYAKFERRHMLKRRDALRDTPAAANTLVKTMKQVFAFAVEYELLETNPCAGIKPLKEGPGYHTWTHGEIAQFRSHHPIGTKARLAMELAYEFSQRISDVHRLGPQFLTSEGNLKFVQKKNEESNPVEIDLPIPTYLRDMIDQTLIGTATFLVTEYGNPFSVKGFGNKFREWCDEAGLPQRCAMHGLRKAGSVAMAESGTSPHQIMSVTGHRTLAEVQRYTEAAKKKKLAAEEFARRECDYQKVPPFGSEG
ncbi:MAG: tyrosine-type recombinase/integrase [Pseudomonadota bacterium]